MTPAIHTPFALFFDQLRSLYSLEIQLRESMPQLVALCTHDELLYVISRHADQNQEQIARILSIIEQHGESPGEVTCKATAGLIEGAVLHLNGVRCPHSRHLLMIAHCLRIEYYEMAAYKITTLLSGRLGLMREPIILSDLLTEEKEMATTLMHLEPDLFKAANPSTLHAHGPPL